MNSAPVYKIDQKKGMGGAGNQSVTINHTHIEQLQDKKYKHLAKTHIGSITFDPASLREVILSLDTVYKINGDVGSDFTSVDVDKKNEINGLTQEFYDELIAVDYEPYFNQVDDFIKQRENEDLQQTVLNIAKSLNQQIFNKRPEYANFETLILDLHDKLIDEEYERLKGKETIVCLILYYLYASCLIGKKTDGEKTC